MDDFQKTAEGSPDNNPATSSFSLTGQERHKVLLEYDQTLRETPRHRCVQQLFEEQAERTPDAVALVFENQELTYRSLNQRANQLARHLQLRGVGPDVLVGICLKNSLELLVAIFGVLKAGGAYVPLDPNYPPDRVAYMLEQTHAPVLIQVETLAATFSATSEIEVVQLDADWPAIASHDSTNLPPLSTSGNLFYVIFTSGSTGQPKGAAVRHGGFSNLLDWFVTDFKISGKDRALVCSSLSFDLTQKNYFATLLKGGALHLCPPGPYDAALMARLIKDHGITLINCTPSAFYPLVERADEDAFQSLASLRMVFLGGETIAIPRIRPWLNHPSCNAEISNTYGPTECTDICAFYRLNRENLDRFEFVPLGGPIHNVQLVILDDGLQLCPPGTPGELCIGGAGVGAGYLNDQEMTRAKFLPNHFSTVSGKYIYRTGDHVRMLPDGNLEFLGRIDHQVKIRGFRIELGEIETALNTHPDIQGAVVIALADQRDEKFLAAYLVARRQPAPAVSELRQFLKAALPDYMVPTVFVTLESFPLNPNGKVDRKVLPLPSAEHFNSGATYAAPQTPEEQQLAAIWSEVLGLPKIGLDDNFFLIGGDSLLAVKLMLRVEKTTGQWLALSTFLLKPTLAGLCEALRVYRERNGVETVVAIRKTGSRPPLFCLYNFMGDVGEYIHLAKALGEDQPVIGIRSPALHDISRLPASIEEAAIEIMHVIRGIQPHGIPALVGYSWAGQLAFEVARQFELAENIQCFTALIGPEIPPRHLGATTRLIHFFRYFPKWFWHLLTDRENRFRRLRRWQGMATNVRASLAENHLVIPSWAETPVTRHMLSIAKKHSPLPKCKAGMNIFREMNVHRGQAHPLRAWETDYLPHGGWNFWTCKPNMIQSVPGDHQSVVTPPAVNHLAKSIRHTFDRYLEANAPVGKKDCSPVLLCLLAGCFFKLTNLMTLNLESLSDLSWLATI